MTWRLVRAVAAVVAALATITLAGELVVIQPVAAAQGADPAAIEHLLRWRLAAAAAAAAVGVVGWWLWGDAARRRAVQRRTAVVGMVAHDIRGPITGIRLVAERLDASAARAAIDRECARLAALADDLLEACVDAERAGAADAEPLCDLLEDVTQRAHAETGCDVVLHIDADLRSAAADRGLARALGNVVENAARHARRAPVAVTARRCGGAIEIEVVDDGDGFAEGFAVQPFRQGAHPGRSGLGLASAVRAVHRAGGTLAIGGHDGGAVAVRVPERAPR